MAKFWTVLPIKAVSENNRRGHWRIHHQRHKEQRGIGRIWAGSLTVKFPLRVTFTRLAPRPLDDDNNVGSMKHIRDGLADGFGVNDRSKEYTFVYQQERAKEYGVRIEVEELA
jgi:hypothetical protein